MISDHDKRREFITGFAGSAGTAVVTLDQAALWIDGRYWISAERQTDHNFWEIVKVGKENAPTIHNWLGEKLAKGSVVGMDPKLISIKEYREWTKELNKRCLDLLLVKKNPVDEVWENQVDRSGVDIYLHSIEYAGETAEEKLRKLRAFLKEKDCYGIVITALDEIAWLLNLRSADILDNPVFYAYGIVTQREVFLFVDKRKVNIEVQNYLNTIKGDVEIKAYKEVGDFLKEKKTAIETQKKKLMVVPGECNYGILRDFDESLILEEEISPVMRSKATKNKTELNGMRNCHIRDGAAKSAWIAWLGERAKMNDQELTEVKVAKELLSFRSKQKDFIGVSFQSISSIGANSADIHYHPTQETDRKIDYDQVYLIDSGGQYLDGTTDVTRTLHFREPSLEVKMSFTQVLKGHIALATAVFPDGLSGSFLDAFARQYLWKAGKNYTHGTGHGVGHFLNVHEGPQFISISRRLSEGILEGVCLSNEPGYYVKGKYGIRIESVMITKKSIHPGFLEFETITMVPIQTELIVLEEMEKWEIEWINSYHAKVLCNLRPLLYEDQRAISYLENACCPLEVESLL